MIFKRCTVGGCDYSHKSFSTANHTVPRLNDEASSLNGNGDMKVNHPESNPQSGRATIPVNSTLAERLNYIDVQLLIEGVDTKMKMQEEVFTSLPYKSI